MKKQPPGEAQVIKTRFIAGAVCPDCQALDRLVVEYAIVELQSSELSRRRCVACGFVEAFNEDQPTASAGVPRVGRSGRKGLMGKTSKLRRSRRSFELLIRLKIDPVSCCCTWTGCYNCAALLCVP